MKNSMKEHIKVRFKTSFKELYDKNYFKNKKAFALSMDITPQFLSQLLNDNTPVPLEFIAKYIETYPINPSYLFTKSDANIFKLDAPHILNEGLASTTGNLRYIERPSSMGQSQNLQQSVEKLSELSNQMDYSTMMNVSELAGLLYKMSQTHLEISKVLERMFKQAIQVK